MHNSQKNLSCLCIALDNVRSAHNVGSIFRTADAVGAEHIYLIGYTPTPIDRFGRAQPDIKKTALGAEVSIPWTHVVTYEDFLTRMKGEGLRTVIVEQVPQAKDYRDISYTEDSVYIFGNEIDGVSETLLNNADEVIVLPMRGGKESLNVSVSVGVALYHARLGTR